MADNIVTNGPGAVAEGDLETSSQLTPLSASPLLSVWRICLTPRKNGTGGCVRGVGGRPTWLIDRALTVCYRDVVTAQGQEQNRKLAWNGTPLNLTAVGNDGKSHTQILGWDTVGLFKTVNHCVHEVCRKSKVSVFRGYINVYVFWGRGVCGFIHWTNPNLTCLHKREI